VGLRGVSGGWGQKEKGERKTNHDDSRGSFFVAHCLSLPLLGSPLAFIHPQFLRRSTGSCDDAKWWPTSLIGGERLGFAKTVAAGKEHGPEKRRKLIRPPIEWLLKTRTFEHVLMRPLQAEIHCEE